MGEAKDKRKLPVIQSSSADAPEDDRPPWHWAGIGVVAVFIAWLPLLQIVNSVIGRFVRVDEGSQLPMSTRVIVSLASALTFAIACFGAGYLIGRFGAKVTKREATISGLGAAIIAWAIAFQSSAGGLATWIVMLVIMAGVGAPAARFGGARGARARLRG